MVKTIKDSQTATAVNEMKDAFQNLAKADFSKLTKAERAEILAEIKSIEAEIRAAL